MVQFGGHTREEVDEAAEEMLGALHETEHEPDVSFYDDPAMEDELWAVREAGLGATAHVPGHRDTWEGWEDSAVHPDQLGDYLRDLQKLYDEFGYSDETGPSLYGHFGQGCVHTRIPFGLYSTEGVAKYRRFMERAADLVVSHGGSLSGEHGDGQSRGELLRRMFGDDLVAAFEELKQVFDPGNLMNPGKVVHPARLDEHLQARRRLVARHPAGPVLPLPERRRLVRAGRRTAASAWASAATTTTRAARSCARRTRSRMEEEHSTRGRARLLFEMLDGHGDSPGRATAGAATRSRTRSTCAWPARAARPTARPTWTWPPTRRSSSPTTGRAASGAARARTWRSAGCR